MTAIADPTRAAEVPLPTAGSGLRRLGAMIVRPIRWIVTLAARISNATHLGRDAEAEIGRWTGARV
jgi:hypothetical protein